MLFTRHVQVEQLASCKAHSSCHEPGGLWLSMRVPFSPNLFQKGEYTDDLYSNSQPESTEKVIGVLDAINGR